MTVSFDIIRMTLIVDGKIDLYYLIIGIIIGFIVTLIGGYLGEKLQASFEGEEAERA